MDTIVRNALTHYDLPEKEPITELRVSGDNHVYVVGVDHKKIVRVSKKLARSDAQFEYEAMRHCAQHNLPVPQWILSRDNTVVTTTDGSNVITMFDFLDGKHITIDAHHLPTNEQAFQAGKMLAKLSTIGRSFNTSSPRTRTIFTELERALLHTQQLKQFEGGNVFITQVHTALAFGKASKSAVGLVHNDYRTGNVLFNENQKVCGIIDFDWCCIGPIMKDLALGLVEWSFPDGQTEPDFRVFDAFLAGYNADSAMLVKRDHKIYRWIQFATLSDAATYFCDRLNSPDLIRDITRSYMYKKFLFFNELDS